MPSQNVCALGLVRWESGLGGENFTVSMQTAAHSPHTPTHTQLPAVFNFWLLHMHNVLISRVVSLTDTAIGVDI